MYTSHSPSIADQRNLFLMISDRAFSPAILLHKHETQSPVKILLLLLGLV